MAKIQSLIEDLLLDHADEGYINHSKSLVTTEWLDFDYEDIEVITSTLGTHEVHFKVFEGVEPKSGELVTAALYNFKKVG